MLDPSDFFLLVCDVDRTIVPNEITSLQGDNLSAITELLIDRIHLLLISGTPYFSSVTTRMGASEAPETIFYKEESIRRRCFVPIRNALLASGCPNAVKYLEIATMSGVMRTTFSYNAANGSFQERHHTDLSRVIAPSMQREIGRTLATAYLRRFATVVLDDPNCFSQALSDIRQADDFLKIRSVFEKSIQNHAKTRFWVFDSEIVILDHENHLDSFQGHQALQDALEMLDVSRYENLFARSGDAFIKITTCEKGETLKSFLDRKKRDHGLVVALGDSRTDDFLWTKIHLPYLPVYLGPAGQIAEYPQVVVARHQGEDNLKDRRTSVIIREIMMAKRASENYFPQIDRSSRTLRC